MKLLLLFRTSLVAVIFALPLALALSAGTGGAESSHPDAEAAAATASSSFEVWVMDQSDTTADGGGTLYVYPGDALTTAAASAEPEVVDLGGEARSLCLAQTGTAPKRPHMLMINAERNPRHRNLRRDRARPVH